MKLHFEAVNDVVTEVLQPCVGLQALVLPRGGLMNNFFLVPPGPSPFQLPTNKEGKSIVNLDHTGDKIDVNIGDFIKFESIIVENVRISYENRMSDKGPVGAVAEVTFSTYEMLTKEGLEEAYRGVVSLNQDVQGTTGMPVVAPTAKTSTPVVDLGKVVVSKPAGIMGGL
jgi:hypothetical protein